jgi:hypothetical protein
MPTRQQIRQEAAKLLGFLMAQGTVTSASPGSIADTSASTGGLRSTADSPYLFDGCYLLITRVGSPEYGNWREIAKQGYTPTSGTVAFASPFATGAGVGDTYEIYAAFNPAQWGECIDAGLTRCRYITRSPISLITDGDMEAADTSAWTGLNATLAKSLSDTVTYGAQSLVVTNTSSNGYAESTAYPCRPGAGYSVWADFRCVGASKSTASLVVWDKTNNAQIAASSGPDGGVNMEGGGITFGFTPPATCYQFSTRLSGAESGAVIAWDDVIVTSSSRNIYTVPSWITTRNQYGTVERRVGSRPFEYRWTDLGFPLDLEEDPTAMVTFRVNVPGEALTYPLFVRGDRPYGPMTSTLDSSSVACPLEWAKYAAACAAYDRYGRAISEASVKRERMDRADCEKKFYELGRQYMPNHPERIGFPEPWAGTTLTPRSLG